MSGDKKKLLEQIKDYFLKNYDLVLSDSELEEVYQSFFHLGKALFIFANQQEVVNDQKTS